MLHTQEVDGSSPLVSTIHEKSERLHNRKCVRIFLFISKTLHIDVHAQRNNRPLGIFCDPVKECNSVLIGCRNLLTVDFLQTLAVDNFKSEDLAKEGYSPGEGIGKV